MERREGRWISDSAVMLALDLWILVLFTLNNQAEKFLSYLSIYLGL